MQLNKSNTFAEKSSHTVCVWFVYIWCNFITVHDLLVIINVTLWCLYLH